MNALSQFSSFFTGGGPFMFVILGVGLTILAMALERFWVIGRASAWNGGKLTRDLVERVRRGDVRGAADLAGKVSSPAGRVAHAILSCPDRSEDSLLNAADGEAAVALPPLSRRLPQLGLLANTATLLGLLGTIFGLTTAFSAVGAADPSQRSAFLAAGISQALNTTAFGLIVAVPSLLVHGWLAGRVERIVESVDEISVKLIRAMSATSRGEIPVSAAPASASGSARTAAAPAVPATSTASAPAATAAARPSGTHQPPQVTR
jgi:biopolymer transport protein ExbB/TolQ